jgi:predicted alpha/beta hydrolase
MGVKLLLSHGRGNRGWMFEKRVPRRIFGPKKEEVIWEWRRLHKDEVYDLYTPNIIQVIQ